MSDEVRRWIWEQGWNELHDIQERSIPVLLKGRADIIIAAPTAAGKTEAAFLPLISRISGKRLPGFVLLYLSPLKALINDQFHRLDRLCETVDLPIHRWHGDVPWGAKARARKNPQGIVLMTPESLEALLVRRGMDIGRLFSPLQAIVIDELHAFVGTERGVQLQSLLQRLENAIARGVIRVGLSATLGDSHTARSFLRPGAAKDIVLLESRANRRPVTFQLRGTETEQGGPLCGRTAEDANACTGSSHTAVAHHIFEHLRGRHALVFARSRGDVELYADLLHQRSEALGVPNEFYPHHANLSRYAREQLETRLRNQALPTTALCTSTLELGVDIGQIESVAQVGAPFSVSSLRQRLGRSGRRVGKPAAMRLYVIERAWCDCAHPVDLLRCELVQAIAMVQLLARDWCEKPRASGRHLSTLVHQILALIAQYGGIRAALAYTILCRNGPFRAVSAGTFARILRAIGSPDTRLIEQSSRGTLLLGDVGERLVYRHDFYAVFETPAEYRIVFQRNQLGTLPIGTPLFPGMSIIFSGRRWEVVEVNHERAMIVVAPGRTGTPPLFGGEGGRLDDTIAEEMRRIYESDVVPEFLDHGARAMLLQARQAYRELGLQNCPSIEKDGDTFLFPWAGTVAGNTLVLALRCIGLTASLRHVVIEVNRAPVDRVLSILKQLSSGDVLTLAEMAGAFGKLAREKYDRFLPRDLLIEELAGDLFDIEALAPLARRLLPGSRPQK